jgi:cytochrome c oxidase subunit 2
VKKLNLWKYAVYGVATLLGISTFAVAPQNNETPRRIEVTVEKFSFEPNAITLKKGEPVVLAIHSVDVTHGLQVKELRIKVEIPKKQTVEIPLTPTVVGNFEGRCAHFCGLGHGSMTFMVNVVE